MKEKKLGGRPKLANYQKRTKCFRVMFTENDYIYIQSKQCFSIISEVSRIITQVKNNSHDSED